MKIDEKAIKQAADMARLIVPDEEASALAQEFSQILKALDDINVNPAGENDSDTASGKLESALREDEAKPFHDAEGLFQGIAREKDGHIAVPRVLDQE
ncbi:MAG: Asp-tRNA(Asn)/Glu-tRNA(Gln) amidotransferase subunit GatC [Clostridiales bacterium]|nr:Asp-tRNA(Asn)/Glu-tRNA(Gln) amidotransferase subunit GatC [Clostridiales bacterium]